ncbi:TolB family protein [Sodalinema gerasimenkoae]|uniref:TolB family protein n=1 Tax=Sodalinema gerasimenkoae TaxID=2862348 RepID=UPI001FEA5691|nr:biopolymer transporter Tol [Sodalinema gerasimenkoae]
MNRGESQSRWRRGWRRQLKPIALSLAISLGLGGCAGRGPEPPVALDSYYRDEQPALSGDGRLLAFVSGRDGTQSILLYDLQRRRFIDLPNLNRDDAIAESPSLSYSGRYIVYLASDRGRPEIELYDRITRRTQVLSSGYRGWVRHPRISPDGRYIVFQTGRRGQWDIEIIDRGPNIELDRQQ